MNELRFLQNQTTTMIIDTVTDDKMSGLIRVLNAQGGGVWSHGDLTITVRTPGDYSGEPAHVPEGHVIAKSQLRGPNDATHFQTLRKPSGLDEPGFFDIDTARAIIAHHDKS